MKVILINGSNDNEVELFHQFIAEIFPGVSFREWHKKGFWTEDYTAYSFVEKNRIISNVCCMKMKILVDGEIYNAVQIGAVGTIPEYGNKGLSKKLMNYVIEKFKDTTDLFFLYANSRVYEFYKKFNFKHVYEKKFLADTNELSNAGSSRKLTIENVNDYNILLEILKNSKPVTKIFGSEDYWYLTMWHVFNAYKNDLYYFDEPRAVAVQKQVCNTLHIYEVFTSNPITLADIALKGSAEKVKVYFPPDQIFYKVSKCDKEDTGLFMLGEIDLDNQEFRFPATAYT